MPDRRPVVGITADRRWEEQAGLFERRGIDVLHGPTMRTLDLSDDSALRDATESVLSDPPRWFVATTGMGMRAWFSAAEGWGLRDRLLATLSRMSIIGRGAKVTSAIRQAGLDVEWRAPNESMEEVLSHLASLDGIASAHLGIQLFDPDDHPSTDALRAIAGSVVEVPVYRWLLPEDRTGAERLVRSAIGGDVDAITFTSQPAVHFLFQIADEIGLGGDLRRACNDGSILVACIGPVCAEAAVEEGITGTVWPEPFRLPPMVRLVAERLTPGAGL